MWLNSSNVLEVQGPIPNGISGLRAVGRWTRLSLVALFVCVPGSINLAITLLPFVVLWEVDVASARPRPR